MIARGRAAAPVLPRQRARRRSPIRAGARARRSARPSGRALGRVDRADQRAIVKPSRLGLDHAATPLRARPGWSMSPHRATTAEANIPALAGQLASVRGERRPRSPRPPDSSANQGALFRLTGNRPWPHCGPTEHPDRATILQQPDPRKLRKCSEFLDSGGWAIQDSNLGPLPYQENLLSPPVAPTRKIIPANRRDGAGGRGLEGTGGDNLVAPWWPHDRRSRVRRRMARKRAFVRAASTDLPARRRLI